MSKLNNQLRAVKAAAPYVKATVVVVANASDAIEYKHKAKVDKALNGAYKAADLVERVL
mgnify:CR=1 FL=1